jgi:hypothetical protein
MAEKIVTKQFKTHSVRQLIESVTEPANTAYYAFAAKHLEYSGGDATIPEPTDAVEDLNIEVYRDMVFGKRVAGSDIKSMIRRVNWTTSTAYEMYDHRSTTLYDDDFYVMVDEGSFHHVYKCLYNANGAVSTIQPTFNDATTEAALFANNDHYYETSDGYQWKYIYTVDDVTFDKFATTNYMPVVANTTVQDNALDGSIDVIKVDTNGAFYNNYIDSEIFTATQITIGGSATKYGISNANTQTNFYANTVLYLSSGTGAGQFKRITSSSLTSGEVRIIIEDAFTITPDATTSYTISPEVAVSSDASQTINCIARAVINATSSNSVHQVEILEQGLGYTFATANVLIGSSGNLVSTAVVTPIISPRGGHGADALSEFGSDSFCMSVTFANNETDKISTDNDYRQFGIIKDPKFSDVTVGMNQLSSPATPGYDGTFVADETWASFTKLRLYETANVNVSNTTITANESDAEWSEYISAGDYVYLTSGTNHHFSKVDSLTATTMVLNTAPSWTSTTTDVYFANITANGVVTTVNPTTLIVDDVTGVLAQDRFLLGQTSMAIGNVTSIDIHGRYSNNATFDTFKQTKEYVGTTGTGTFIEDEFITQVSGATVVASGYLQSQAISGGSTILNLTNVVGEFTVAGEMQGQDSLATMTITDKYNGEIETNSGDIIFLQNDSAISRADTQTETIRIIITF